MLTPSVATAADSDASPTAAAAADACRKQFAARCLNISLDGSKTLPAAKC